MREHIIRFQNTILLLGLVGYILYHWMQWSITVDPSMINYESIFLMVVVIVLWITWLYSVLIAHRLSKPKLVLACAMLVLLMIASYGFVDVASSWVYLSDLMRVVSVYLFIAVISWFWYIVDQQKTSHTTAREVIEI